MIPIRIGFALVAERMKRVENCTRLQIIESLPVHSVSSSWVPDEHTDFKSCFGIVHWSKGTEIAAASFKIGP